MKKKTLGREVGARDDHGAEVSADQRRAFERLIGQAYLVAQEVGREVEKILEAGRDRPLPAAQARRLLERAVEHLRASAGRRGDQRTATALSGEVTELVDQILYVRERLAEYDGRPRVQLEGRNGISPGPVRPKPVFHGRDVAMNQGFVRTTDIALWEDNARLDIHIGQFRQHHGRGPSPEELLDIMLSRMPLPGLEKANQFEIVELARSIAINGVRKPPILDTDGTLLDGNRRVAACRFILASEEFDPDQKRRAERVFVWQLTDQADDDDRNAVVVSLNFEPDCKQDWPEYVKARKVFDEWQSIVALEPQTPGSKRQSELKRELSKKFALGPDTGVVNRYLKMVEWANEFEEYHINQCNRDEFAVKHQANRYFQYFDELAKGAGPGGVAHALSQSDAFKHLVFDLLYQGKFQNWRQIRELKHVFENEEARGVLQRAREATDPEDGAEHVDNALAIARAGQAEQREVGANTRIESFVKWLEQLPMRAFRDSIKPENLKRLLRALKLVEKQAEKYAKALRKEA